MSRTTSSLVFVVLGSMLAARDAFATEVRASDYRGAQGEPLCFDVAGQDARNGASILLWSCHGQANQQFSYDPVSGQIRSLLGNWCLDVSGAQAYSGAPVQLYACNNSPAQQFDVVGGAIRFRAAPSFCLDAMERSSWGARLGLWGCNGGFAQGFALTSRYGNRRFDELTWLTAHNAFANREDSNWTLPNQSRGLGRQLDDGVRAFMFDVYSFESGTARCVLSLGSDCYGWDIYLCHGGCGGVPGMSYALPRQRLSDALAGIVAFLETHPDEIVTVFLEDYSDHDQLGRVLDGVAGLRELQFDPWAWNVQGAGWPLARDMVDANARLLVFSDNWERTDIGVPYGASFTVENHWSIGAGGNYSCPSRWDAIPLDQVEYGWNRLFVMNHFRDTASASGADGDNSYANLMYRITDFCAGAAGRKPNYVAVDFYDSGGWGPARIVADVDRARALLFEHDGYAGRAQLLAPGWTDIDALSVGNDAISSLALLPGTSATLYEHGHFAGRSASYASSTPWLADFNDLGSSVYVTEDARTY